MGSQRRGFWEAKAARISKTECQRGESCRDGALESCRGARSGALHFCQEASALGARPAASGRWVECAVALVTLRAPRCIFTPSSLGRCYLGCRVGPVVLGVSSVFLLHLCFLSPCVPPGKALSPCSRPSSEDCCGSFRCVRLVWGDGGSQFFWSFLR